VTGYDAASDAVAVEAVEVSRTYRGDGVDVLALRGVSMRVHAGEYVAIVGPSGSGKSTLMHLLGCLDRPTTGRLLMGGRDTASMSDGELAQLRNRTVGFVFQSFHLLSRTSALDNDFPNQINNVLAFPGVFRGLLDAQSHQISVAVLLAAARALAGVVGDDELNANYIVPSVFNADVAPNVAAAVRDACLSGGR
jgi:putative ABC transport system ATP-binding protein